MEIGKYRGRVFGILETPWVGITMGEGKPLTDVGPKWEGCQRESKIESRYVDRFVLGLIGPSQVVSEL